MTFATTRINVAVNAFTDAAIAGKSFMECSAAEDAALAEFDAAQAAAASNAEFDFYNFCADSFTSPAAILTGMGAVADGSEKYWKRATAVARANVAARTA